MYALQSTEMDKIEILENLKSYSFEPQRIQKYFEPPTYREILNG